MCHLLRDDVKRSRGIVRIVDAASMIFMSTHAVGVTGTLHWMKATLSILMSCCSVCSGSLYL